MPLKIIRNDITRVKADAIVNTANPLPRIGAGTDRAIHDAAGPELLASRKQIGPIAVGSCAATPAFRLNASYVLHTVSPGWEGGGKGEAETLRRAYDAALETADSLGCRSVAFPLLAAGSYGFPHDLALSVAIQAFTDFLLDHDVTILLVLFNGKAFGLAASLFDDLKSYIDDNYVDAQEIREYGAAAQQRPRREPPTALRRNARAESGALPRDADFCSSAMAMPPAMAMPSAAMPAGESLEEFLRQSESTFTESLLDLLRERAGKDSEVYKRAEISKQLFSKILSNRDYKPTKDTAIQLAIGLQLDLAQTQKLLEKAGYALTRSSKADLVVQYYIERKIYSVSFINEALSDCGLPLLKTGLRS